MLSSNFLLPLSTKSGNRVKMKRNYQWPAKIAKVNVNMDCFSLIKGQWKLFKGQWKVREFLTFWWVATLLWVRNIPDGGIDINWWNKSYFELQKEIMFTFISALNIFVDCERQFICLIVFFIHRCGGKISFVFFSYPKHKPHFEY